jgi:hypothetical protein
LGVGGGGVGVGVGGLGPKILIIHQQREYDFVVRPKFCVDEFTKRYARYI